MFYKAIIQGRLEFGTQKSYDTVVGQYGYRSENYHKDNVMFAEEDIFKPEELALDIPRHVGQVMEKSFKNTLSLLDYSAQFAITGSIVMWLMDEGSVIKHYAKIEPSSEKKVVQNYLKGKALVKEAGKEEEAIGLLTKAIDRYDRHAQAYERRAKVNYIMKKYADAKRDYNKALGIDPSNPHAYYGRAKVNMISEDWQEAINDFDAALKKSFALQPIYWKARRLKSICHEQLKQWKEMAFDLKLFTKRNFDKDEANLIWKKWSYIKYAIALMELEEYEEAIVNLTAGLDAPDPNGLASDAEIYRYRGISRKKAGKNGHLKDLKEAVALGDEIAAAWIKKR